MPDRSIVYFHTSEGDTPASHRSPWLVDGAPTVDVDDDWCTITVGSAGLGRHRRKLFKADRKVRRYRDQVTLQMLAQGVSATAGWASGNGPIGLVIHDGYAKIGVSIGATLRWINPDTGATVGDDIEAGWSWLLPHVYRLHKDASAGWVLEIDGQRTYTLPYDLAPVDTGVVPYMAWGHLDSASTSVSRWQRVEGGLNMALPRQQDVERVTDNMLASINLRWNERWEAWARALVGAMEHVSAKLEGVWDLFTARRQHEQQFAAPGDQLGDVVEPAWTLTASAQQSIVRNRIRMDHTTTVAMTADFSGGATLPATAERYVRALYQVDSYTPDAQGRVGPHLAVHDGSVAVHAWLVEHNDGWAWVLADNAGTGAYTALGEPWTVDLLHQHHVELQVLGEDWVLLLVDGRVVNRRPYSDFTIVSAADSAVIGTAPITTVVDWEDSKAGRRVTDLQHRQWFTLLVMERMLPVGGCERNDELDTWLRGRFEVMASRGTDTGILEELKRITCSGDVNLVEETSDGSWYLELTYPEITPVYLEMVGFLVDVYAEIGDGAINMTPQQIADWAVRYLLPISTVEFEYFMAVYTTATGASTTPSTGTTRILVDSTEHFDIGDQVTIRDAANTVQEIRTITNIGTSPVFIDVATTSNSWVLGDVVRKTLAQS